MDENFEIEVKDDQIAKIVAFILRKQADHICRVCERYGEDTEDVRMYDVYVITSGNQKLILKKSNNRELSIYENYLSQSTFRVPKYYGKYVDEKEIWIMIEHIEGEDLRNMTDQIAVSAADTIVEIQNRFWNSPDLERFNVYWERINKRYRYIQEDEWIGPAYQLFLKRQSDCPRTLSNGDFLAYNAIFNEKGVFAIDWGFGGIMPYTLDIARFIAHGTEDKATFPFYMNEKQKQYYIQRIYNQLIQKPTYSQFIMDIKLAVLNEYVEFVEAEEDEDKWYYQHAQALAKEILDSMKSADSSSMDY